MYHQVYFGPANGVYGACDQFVQALRDMTLRDDMDDRNVTDTRGRPVSFCPYCGARIMVRRVALDDRY